MLNSRNGKLAMAVMAAALAGAGVSRADMATQTVSVGTSSAPGTFSPTFNQFDTSLGTLNSVTISLDLTVPVSGAAINISAAPGTSFTNYVQNLNLQITDPYGGTNSQFYDFTGNASYSGGGTVGALFTITDDPFPSVAYSGNTSVPGANLGDYEGVATISPTFSDTGVTTEGGTPGGSGLIGFGSAVQITGNATITYDFTPNSGGGQAPEPASLSLLAIGGAAFLGRRRKR